jgi:hypothetical protein
LNPRTLIKIYSTHRKGLGAPEIHPAAQTMSSPRFNHSSRSRCDPEKRHAGASGRVALGRDQIFCIQLFRNRDRLGQTADSGHYYHCTDGKKVHRQRGLRQHNISETEIWRQLELAVQEISLTGEMTNEIAAKVSELNRDDAERAKRVYAEDKERLEVLVRKQDQLYDDYTKQLVDEDDYRRLKAKTKDEIHLLKGRLENDYLTAQQLVRERLKFTLELAKEAESNWKKATPSDRIVLLKNVLSNFSLDGLNVRYDLKKAFAVLAEIKIKGVSEKWCPPRDSRRTTHLAT